VALAALLLPAATLAGYARLTLLDSDQFAARATASVQNASVRSLIADRVTDEVIRRHRADLVSARPITSSAISGIVGSGAFASLFRRAVLDAHRAVVTHDEDTLTFTLADVGTVAAAAIKQVKPSLAAQVEASGNVALVAVGALVVAQPLTALQLAATLAGVYLVYSGVTALLQLIYRPGRSPSGGGDAQLDVGAAEGLVLVAAGPRHRRAAAGRGPRPADRHALRRQARRRARADVLRERVGPQRHAPRSTPTRHCSPTPARASGSAATSRSCAPSSSTSAATCSGS
jgi:hypothetical protein